MDSSEVYAQYCCKGQQKQRHVPERLLCRICWTRDVLFVARRRHTASHSTKRILKTSCQALVYSFTFSAIYQPTVALYSLQSGDRTYIQGSQAWLDPHRVWMWISCFYEWAMIKRLIIRFGHLSTIYSWICLHGGRHTLFYIQDSMQISRLDFLTQTVICCSRNRIHQIPVRQ